MAQPDGEKIIYTMSRVSKTHNGKPILKDISLSYFYGAKIGVLGLNGSGKSTLLRILAGKDTRFDGQTSVMPGFTVGFLEQEPPLPPGSTVRECAQAGIAEKIKLVEDYHATFDQMAEDLSDEEMNQVMERQGDLQEEIDRLNAWDLDSELDMAMDALRCPPGDTSVEVISGGERRRVALCALLLRKPDILLLDEPTNHLDAETVHWLEQHLQRYEGTIIAVTHDRYFLDNVAGWILELDRGQGIPFKGNYSSWLDQKQKRLAVEEKEESARQKALKREMEWAGRTPAGRQSKNKARLKRYESLLDQSATDQERELEIYIPPGPRLGNLVIKATKVAKAYDDILLYDNLKFDLPPAGIVGIIGPNGAGKTTLFRMITGQETPDAGTLEIGDTVKLAYVDQSRAVLTDDKAVWEVIGDGEELVDVGNRRINVRAYAAKFGFTGGDQQKKVGVLSGGERNRIHLARILRSGANVLLLDEPTNDLDVNTIRALEDALDNFGGCAVIISHDRWFLDRVATHILAFENESRVHWHEGNFTSYEEDYKNRMGKDADKPHRVKYRKLTR